MKIQWMPLAVTRVEEIVDLIAMDRPRAAEQWAVGVFDFVDKLERSPKRGRVVPELGREEIREIRYGQYRILYRLDPDLIAILTVRHGRRLLDLGEVEAE
jgi:plasmid stabilization system protein ParE